MPAFFFTFFHMQYWMNMMCVGGFGREWWLQLIIIIARAQTDFFFLSQRLIKWLCWAHMVLTWHVLRCACWRVDIFVFYLLPDPLMQVGKSWHNQAIKSLAGSGLCAVLSSLAGRQDFLVSKANSVWVSAFYQQEFQTPSFLRWNHQIPTQSCQYYDSPLSTQRHGISGEKARKKPICKNVY